MNVFTFYHACGSVGYGESPEGCVEWVLGENPATIEYPHVYDASGNLIGSISCETSNPNPDTSYIEFTLTHIFAVVVLFAALSNFLDCIDNDRYGIEVLRWLYRIAPGAASSLFD